MVAPGAVALPAQAAQPAQTPQNYATPGGAATVGSATPGTLPPATSTTTPKPIKPPGG